ncbi:MAG: transglutaminase family protein [Planctomycetaceae bacterium]
MDSQLPACIEQLQLDFDVSPDYDVAEWNLRLAKSLPAAEDLDVSALLDKIDRWAELVRQATERQYYTFIESPSQYESSQGYFCVLVLITVLERDLGVRYNPARVRDQTFQDPHCIDPDVSDSRDMFIHGILDGPGGTCSSMPVLYTAVGRRLGYPMRLVQAPGHLFSRWDDPEGTFNGVPDVFNIDASGHGFSCHPDEYYHHWPREWDETERKNNWYLKSMSPFEEIADFLSSRGSCLECNGQLDAAFLAFHWAYQLTQDQRYYQHAAKLQERLEAEQRRLDRRMQEINDEQRFRFQQREKLRRQKAFHHSPNCSCANCRKEREQAEAAMTPSQSKHSTSCQCLACRKERESVPKLGAQHPPTCNCFDCRNGRHVPQHTGIAARTTKQLPKPLVHTPAIPQNRPSRGLPSH